MASSSAALLRLIIVPFVAFAVLAKAETCGCEGDKNGPVCHPIKLDYIADCAAQAECRGERHNYVACASLRAVSWRHDCSCRLSWDPVCNWKGEYVGPNWECSQCLKLNAVHKCSDSNMKTPEMKQGSGCQCPKEFQDQQEGVCSTVTGSWLANDSCEAYCKGFKSFLPCSKMPNRNALVPSTGLEDMHIEKQTCSMVGAKVGDIAGNLGCQKVMQLCRAAGWNKSSSLDGWDSGLVILPSCFSEESMDCYEAATDWALRDKECTAVLSQDGRLKEAECSAATARRLFAGAVSRVCGEEVRDGKPYGFWGSKFE